MSSNFGFEPTLDGLNNIDSDSTTTNNIICNTLLVNTTALVPTVSPLSNDTNVATTAWVTAHAGGAYVTTNTTQTVTGEKTFSNANTFITGNTVTNSIVSTSATTDINIGSALTTGDVNLGSSGGATGVALNWGGASNSGTLSFKGGSFNLASTGIFTASSGSGNNADLFTGQGGGTLNLATLSARTGQINISNGATATNNISIGNQRSGAGTIAIGSNNSSTNTVNIQSRTINIGTVSPVATTNDVNIGNGQLGSSIILNSETTCIDDFVVNNIKSTSGSMTIATDPLALTDDITISSANEVTLSGSNAISFNGSDVFFNNTNKIDISSSNLNVIGGQLTVDGGPFVIKSGGQERLSVNYALGETTIKIKTDGDVINFSGSDNNLIMSLSDTFAPLYKTSSITVPDTTSFNLIPAGTILTSVVSTAPSGYVLCNGTSYSTTASSGNQYYELFLAIAYTFGGSGATFNVPNFQGAFLRGASTQTVGGVAYTAAAVGTAQQDSMLAAATNSSTLQGYNNVSAGSGRQVISRGRIPTDPIDACSVIPVFTRQNTTEVRPFNYSVYYYIKY